MTPHDRPFRFALQLDAAPGADLVATARRAEEAGFDVVVVADHVGAAGLAPMPLLASLAVATQRIRLGTYVLNVGMRNPVQLTWEAATIDHLSGGRFELGLGAGHTPAEFAACGLELQPAAVRKERLSEAVEVIRSLLDGDEVTFDGHHHHLDGARTVVSVQDRLPILVGGNGRRLLTHAARHADIIGLNGLGRTLPDGHQHELRWSPDQIDEQVRLVREAAGERWSDLELNALVQLVTVTDDREAALADVVERVGGLSLDDARTAPYLAVGTHDEIAEHLRGCRARWGVSYVTVRELDGFAPVIERLRAS